MDTRTNELAAFKRRINLTEYAASCGFELDRKASSRSSVAMRHPEGDKLIIGMEGETWVYFSVHEGHSGTIIDLIQHREGLNLGQVRKALRPWLGQAPRLAPPTPPDAYVQRLDPSPGDQLAVLARYEAAERVEGYHPYLCGVRKLDPALVASGRFQGCIRTDARGNALFPHHDEHGALCGFEIKNEGFTGFSPGGRKGLWGSRRNDNDTSLVIAETAIDAMSYIALRGDDTTRCVSIAGQMNPHQPGMLRAEIRLLPKNGKVVMALDHDEGGEKLSRQIADVHAESGRGDLELVDDRPLTPGSDWNDQLRSDPPTTGKPTQSPGGGRVGQGPA